MKDFENDPSLTEEQKGKMRREKAAIERKRIRELIRLRRDVEAEKTGAGVWSKQAEEEFKKRILLPNILLKTVKTIIVLSIIDFIYVAWLSGHRTTACQNKVLTGISSEDRILYVFYWCPTFFHLFSIVIMFSCFTKGSVVFSIIIGVVSVLWHLANTIFYFTMQVEHSMPIADALMYWGEMIFCVVIVVSTIQVLLKVDFVPLSPEEIDKIELEELKAEKSAKDKLKMERQVQQQNMMGADEFIPQGQRMEEAKGPNDSHMPLNK